MDIHCLLPKCRIHILLCDYDGFTKPTGCKRFLREARFLDLFGEKCDRLENWFKGQDPGSVYRQFLVVSHREERDLPPMHAQCLLRLHILKNSDGITGACMPRARLWPRIIGSYRNQSQVKRAKLVANLLECWTVWHNVFILPTIHGSISCVSGEPNLAPSIRSS